MHQINLIVNQIANQIEKYRASVDKTIHVISNIHAVMGIVVCILLGLICCIFINVYGIQGINQLQNENYPIISIILGYLCSFSCLGLFILIILFGLYNTYFKNSVFSSKVLDYSETVTEIIFQNFISSNYEWELLHFQPGASKNFSRIYGFIIFKLWGFRKIPFTNFYRERMFFYIKKGRYWIVGTQLSVCFLFLFFPVVYRQGLLICKSDKVDPFSHPEMFYDIDNFSFIPYKNPYIFNALFPVSTDKIKEYINEVYGIIRNLGY
ncbi:MAG: hypothetical protein ABDH21_02145 [bacterium]